MTLEKESEAIEPSIALADVESSLALFAEGIAGRYLHIRSNQEFTANPKLTLEESGGQNSDTLFLPESVATTHASTYRVLAMEQIGLRECDTLSFRMQTAVEQIPSLALNHHRECHRPTRNEAPSSNWVTTARQARRIHPHLSKQSVAVVARAATIAVVTFTAPGSRNGSTWVS